MEFEKQPLLLAAKVSRSPSNLLNFGNRLRRANSASLRADAAPSPTVAHSPRARGACGCGGWLASLPALPPSPVPRAAPLSRARARLYLALSEPYTSLLGFAAMIANAVCVCATIIVFSTASFPHFRVRAATGVFGPSEAAMEAVNAVAAAVFAALLLARAACFTAVPDLLEARALHAATSSLGGGDGGSGGDAPDEAALLQAAAATAAEGGDLAAALLDLDGTLTLRIMGAPSGAPALDAAGWPAAWRAPLCGAELRARNAPRIFTWACNLYNLIDALSLVPFIAELARNGGGGGGDELLRLLRFMCLLRLVRLASDTVALRLLRRAVLATLDSLRGALWLLLLTMLLIAAAAFVAEKGDYDAATGLFLRRNVADDGVEDSPFNSVPQVAYWVAGTITSTGYGDLVPTSIAGKILASLTMALGIFLLAVPATLVGFNYSFAYDEYRARLKALSAESDAAAAAAAAAAEARARPTDEAAGYFLKVGGGGGGGGPAAEVEAAVRAAEAVAQPGGAATAAATAAVAARIEELARAIDAAQIEMRSARAAIEALARTLGTGAKGRAADATRAES